MTTKTQKKQSKAAEDYLALIHQFPLRPIQSEAAYDRALDMLNGLLDRSTLSKAEKDYLEILGDIISAYERAEHPIPPLSDAELLKYLIEEKGVPQRTVALATGVSVSTICQILSSNRGIARSHIPAFAKYFGVSRGVFLANDGEG